MLKLYYDHGHRLDFPQTKAELTPEEETAAAADMINAGGIAVVQGGSCYYLLCLADHPETVKQLRVLKQSFFRPLALCCVAEEQVELLSAELTEPERELLTRPYHPIVLVQTAEKTNAIRLSFPEQAFCLAPGKRIEQLARQCGPLVLTSANRWRENLSADEETLGEWMLSASMTAGFTLTDSVFFYFGEEGKLPRLAEPSVLRSVKGRTQVLRRGAGLLEQPIELKTEGKKDVFAAGSDEDTAFLYTKGQKAYLSRTFGSMKSPAVSESYTKELKEMRSRLAVYPDRCVGDFAPVSVSAALAQYEAKNIGKGVTFSRMQHSQAHAASVLMERSPYEPALAVVFDNAHKGTDGTLWGMDFFSVAHGTMVREAGLFPRNLLGDEVLPANAQSLAYSFLSDCDVRSAIHESGAGAYEMKDRNFRRRLQQLPWTDGKAIELVYAAVLHKINTVPSSSLGSLLFTAAVLLGSMKEVHYPLEALDLLDKLAGSATAPTDLFITVEQDENGLLLGNAAPLLDTMFEKMLAGEKAGNLAAGLFQAIGAYVCETLLRLIKKTGVDRVVLAGGMLADRRLLISVLTALEQSGIRPEINELVPPGDSGIALGQAFGRPEIL